MQKIFFILFFFAVTISCEKSIQNKPNVIPEEAFNILKEKYSLVGIDYSVNLSENKTKLENIIKVDFPNLHAKNLLNFRTCIVYRFSISDLKVVAIPYMNDHNKFQIVKYTEMSGQMLNAHSKWIDISFDKDGNGTIFLSSKNNTNDFTKINFLNGRIDNPSIVMKPKSNNSLKSFHFCQAESGESFQGCFEREVHEFCDDWVSTVAFYTNPQIAVLIATMCTCEYQAE